jgi:hypothetical protein
MAKATWRTVNVYADGSIDYVSKMSATTGDAIVWFVNNTTPLSIRVKVKDFRKYNNSHQPGASVSAVDFFADTCDVDPGTLPGIIAGQVILLPSSANPTVETKYTIAVKIDGGAWIVHDPDLDVDRPSGFA